MITLKLTTDQAALLLQHMRWEDVGKEGHADHVIAGIYEAIKAKHERAVTCAATRT